MCVFLVLVFSLGFFFRSFVENPLSSSRHILDLLTQAAGRRVSREEDDAGSSSEFVVVVGVFVLRFVCRANADGGDRHVFCSVVVFIHARTHL